jgi:hypothetical protein
VLENLKEVGKDHSFSNFYSYFSVFTVTKLGLLNLDLVGNCRLWSLKWRLPIAHLLNSKYSTDEGLINGIFCSFKDKTPF